MPIAAAIPLALNVALAALFAPEMIGQGRDLLEDLGMDPTGRKGRASSERMAAMFGQTDLGDVGGRAHEKFLDRELLPTLGGVNKARSPGNPALNEALDILGDEAYQLRQMSAQSRPSLGALFARAGLT